MTTDLNIIAANLELHADGIWYAKHHTPVAYPEDGNEFCYGIEEESFWFNHRNTFILEALHRFPPKGSLFDIGGGNGFVAKAICDSGIDTILVEPGIKGIHNAMQRGITQLVCASLEDAQFNPQSIPAVGMFDVLEHIPQDLSFLKTIHRLLIPGGLIYLTVPAYQFLWSTEDDFAQHYRRYSIGRLKETLNRAGFTVEYATYIFASLPAPIFLFRTLPSRLGWRKRNDSSREKAELSPSSDAANSLLDQILRLELNILRSRKTLPFGGSCLAVARSSSDSGSPNG